jgi:hypothetical protein
MPTTTNFGWTTPADTDLVKDGAAAIRTLAGNIDTSLVDLKGGTTGQVLAKNSNTDLDFTWSADAGIPATIVDAKGDIIAATAADTVSRLAVGANNTVLTADSSTATGLKWAAAGSGATYSIFRDEKTSGTSGGTFTSGAWRTRDINATQINQISGSSIASNQITLPAGTFYISASAPACRVNEHQARFYNITDSTVEILGNCIYSEVAATAIGMGISTVEGIIVITSSKVFELQHRCNSSFSDYGFGLANAFGNTQVYSTVTIAKVA